MLTDPFISYKEDNFCYLLFAYVHRTLHYIQGRHFCWLAVCLLFTIPFIINKGDNFYDFLFAYCSLNPSLYTRETFVTGCLLYRALNPSLYRRETTFVTSRLLTVHWTLHYIQGRQLLWLAVSTLFTEPFILYKIDNFCSFLFVLLYTVPSRQRVCWIFFSFRIEHFSERRQNILTKVAPNPQPCNCTYSPWIFGY